MFGADDEAFDEFMKILEMDNLKSFKNVFKNMGKGYRVGAKQGTRARAAKAAKGGMKGMDGLEDMMAMMMMGEMMGDIMGAFDSDDEPIFYNKKNGPKKGTKKKDKDSSDGEWETIEENGKKVNGKTAEEDDGWETESD